MFNPPTSPDTRSATSSQASADGPSQHDLLGGQMIASSGRARARASRSRSRVKAKPRMTIGICGHTSSGSSVPEGPLSSWESRLRQRLAAIGSTECSLTWRELDTPAGRSLSQLVPSMPRTEGIASGLWPTPTTRDHKDSLGMSFAPRKDGASRLDLLPRQVFWLQQNHRLWPTPTAADSRRGCMPPRPQDTGIPLSQAIGLAVGLPPFGSRDTTTKGVGLNPAFPCWLMGFPVEWLLCAPASNLTPKTRKRSTGTPAPVR